MKIRPLFFLVVSCFFAAFAADRTHWVVTWTASPAPQLPDEAQMRSAKLDFDHQTLREIIHTSIGGDAVRVRLSNAYGKQTVAIGPVHIAIHAKDSGIVEGSDHPLTFSGKSTVSIPPSAVALSDPVKLAVPASGDLAISMYFPSPAEGAGIHYSSQQTSYIGAGEVVAATSIRDAATLTSWAFLTGVDVLAPDSAGAVVAFGDSITDGARSTVDTNHRWPNILADRFLHEKRVQSRVAVVDAGIGGNRILHDATNPRFGDNALARFDRDVLIQPGVKYVIVLEGINDIGHPGSSASASEAVTADDIIDGLKQMIERAHEKGIKIYGATLTPFEDTTIKGYFSASKEEQRKHVNEWIRTGGAFDGVIDFDKAMRDPEHPDHILPAYDSGDHLHPGDAGYEAMGKAIDLALFK